MKHLMLFESHSEFDLNKEFDYLNRVLFDGELKAIPIKWSNTKTRSGALVGTREIHNNAIKSETLKHIEISRFFNKTEEQLRGILAHEMIHLYIHQKGIKDDGHHGYEFMKKFKEVNAKGVVDIPLKDTVSDDEVTDASPLNKQVVVFYHHDLTKNVKLISILDEKIFTKENLESILDTVKYTSEIAARDFDLAFFRSLDGSLKKYPKAMKFKGATKLRFASAPANIDEVMARGNAVETYKIRGGQVE